MRACLARPVQSQWVLLGDYVRALDSVTTVPQNNFSHCPTTIFNVLLFSSFGLSY